MELPCVLEKGKLRIRLGLALGVTGLALVGIGCHIWDVGHLQSIHGAPYASLERYCVEDLSSNPPTTAQADAWIEQALWNNGHGQDWESLGTINQGSYGDCANVDTLEEISELDIIYRLVDEGPPICGQVSCIVHLEWNSEHHGHRNYDQVEIYLDADEIWGHDTNGDGIPDSVDVDGDGDLDAVNIGEYRFHLINHETGHAYGLDDAVAGTVLDSYEDCWITKDLDGDEFDDVVRVFSIMHNAGHCGISFASYPWPTACDLRIVDLIAQEHPFSITEDLADFKGGLCED